MRIDPATPMPLEKKKNMPLNATLGPRFQSRFAFWPPRRSRIEPEAVQISAQSILTRAREPAIGDDTWHRSHHRYRHCCHCRGAERLSQRLGICSLARSGTAAEFHRREAIGSIALPLHPSPALS